MASRSAGRRSPPYDRPDMRDLRIVLLGKNVSENSRVGNTILGTAAFDSEVYSSYLQQHSMRISALVEERHIAVINTQLLQPHVSYHQITQRVRECVSLSAPGPHVFILVLQYNDFSEEDRNRVKTVLKLFSEKAIKHTIVVTTDEETRTFKWTSMIINNLFTNLIKECGGGHLKFDKNNAGWRSEMISRIEDILKEEQEEFLICIKFGDGGGGVSVDEDPNRSGGLVRGDDKEKDGKLNERTRTGSDGGVTTSGKTKLNIVLCGYNTTLKSSVSKIIRGKINRLFHQREMRKVCVKKEEKIHGQLITVIELPALTRLSEEEVKRETLNCVSLCDPGVHLFILVIPVTPLTNEDKAEMEKITRIFYSKEHFMVLFTSELTIDKSVSDFVSSAESQRFVSLYGSWNSVMGLKDQRNSVQIPDLLDCVERMKTEPYSLQMYMRAPEKRIRHELEEKLSERENEIKELEEKIKTPVPEGVKLNLVVCGSDRTLKSFISDLILNQRDRRSELSSECVRRDVKVCEHLISLVELPALIKTQLSEEEVMRQTLRCVSLCDPGVHLFLLIISDAPLTDEDKAEMEKIQRMFSSRIKNYTMVLIYQNPEHQTAELNEETQSVIESFGGRHHFIGPNTQVSMLMERLMQMVEANSGVCFSTETLLEAQMEKLLKFEEMKKRIQSLETWFQSQDSRDSADDLRIVLLGKTGVGKSSTGNTILGRGAFISGTSHESVTKECRRERAEINGRHVTVIDTPGLFDTELTNEKVQREITNCISMILPGPHVFIIVLSLGQRFTQEEETTVKIIQEMFGENSSVFTMVLFTRGDDLKDITIEQWLGKPGSPLMNLIEACGNRYHVFNNNQTGDQTQVSDLLKKIDDMVKENGDSYYSCKMFREMEREIQEQQKKILMVKVEQLNRDKEELVNKHEEEKKRMMEEQRQNHDKERKRREKEFREREEQYKRDIKEREKQERKMREEMKREREEWEKQKQQEKQRRDEEDERRRKKEQAMRDEYNQRLKQEEERMKMMFEEERQNNDKDRKRREKEFREREERYKTELKSEREEWERQKQQERLIRDEENERRRKIEKETWDEYYEKLKREVERRHRMKELLQSKHEEERERMKMKMEEERLKREKERRRREERYIEERYKRDIKDIEDQERKMREEMKREREEWNKQKQQER
ncbi:GTPase IMAP family member 8-like [Ctenopharyngodon idella]|uniref:GTPase IMAP family member 8-like n=1 Tax=Ctenopharyngodon idella TaxID=7959 RepID=UPI00222FD59F|nr:GTPase IMAP family member 8-like [Ctenopharyngodon idella]